MSSRESNRGGRGRGSRGRYSSSRGRSSGHSQETRTSDIYRRAEKCTINPELPTIVPIGFDCGPYVLLVGGTILDQKYNPPTKNMNVCDLPFDTVVVKEVTPVVKYLLTNTDDNATYFKNNTNMELIMSETKQNSLGVSFQHITNYNTYIDGNLQNKKLDNEFFKSDMNIRINNFKNIITSHKENPNPNHKLIFIRKSHSDEHHPNISIKENTIKPHPYSYAAKAVDFKDAKALSEYLKSIDITNFCIILFLCCKTCYANLNYTISEMKNSNILCFKTYEDTLLPYDKPYRDKLLTSPKFFTDCAYPILHSINNTNISILNTYESTYESTYKFIIENNTKNQDTLTKFEKLNDPSLDNLNIPIAKPRNPLSIKRHSMETPPVTAPKPTPPATAPKPPPPATAPRPLPRPSIVSGGGYRTKLKNSKNKHKYKNKTNSKKNQRNNNNII